MRNTLRILSIVLLIASIFQARAADTKISALVELAVAPATDDLFAIVDISDTTQAASGSTKKIQVTNLINDTAYASSWDSKTTQAASKNAIYDWGHTFDTDDDGKVNVLDQGVGIAITDSSGVLQTPITTSALLASAISDETGTSLLVYNTSPALVSPTFSSAVTIGSDPALAANGITIGTTGIIFEGTTADAFEGLLTPGDPTADRTWTLPNATGNIVLEDNTVTFTGKTFDTQATGNTLKWIDYDKWVFPQLADEAGAIITTNNAASELNGHATFSGSGATNANWVVYEWVVPDDIDTSVDLKVARFKFTTAGTSTSSATFNIGMQDMADSADQETISLANFSNWVAMATGTLTSPAAKDGFTLSAITLTSWKSNLTAGHTVHIMVCRDGAGDANNDAMTDKFLVISYGRTQ
jgi:hypothetical protein